MEAGFPCVAVGVAKVDGDVGGEFDEDLPACTTGRATVFGANSDCQDALFATGDHFEDGSAFGTVGQAVGGVFDVDAGDDVPVGGEEGGSNFVVGVGGVGILPAFTRFKNQCLLLVRGNHR